MTTIAELMDLAEIPRMDDYGDPVPRIGRVVVKQERVAADDLDDHLVVDDPNLDLELDDIEEEEGERKVLLDRLFPGEKRTTLAQLQPMQPLQQLHFSMAPLAGENSALAPRPPPVTDSAPPLAAKPEVPPPPHLQMDALERARAFGQKFIGPREAAVINCHRCEAPMRVCVRKLKYVDHVKEYPSYRCTRKGCQTFKSMRIVEQPELTRAPRVPCKPLEARTRAAKKAAAEAEAAMQQADTQPPDASKHPVMIALLNAVPAHLPMANPYAGIVPQPSRDAPLPRAPAADPPQTRQQTLRALLERSPADPAKGRNARLYAAAMNLRLPLMPAPGSMGDICAPFGGPDPNLARHNTADGGANLANSAGGVPNPTRKLPPRKRSRYDTCTQAQKDAVAALLRKHDEELQLQLLQEYEDAELLGEQPAKATPRPSLAKRAKTEAPKPKSYATLHEALADVQWEKEGEEKEEGEKEEEEETPPAKEAAPMASTVPARPSSTLIIPAAAVVSTPALPSAPICSLPPIASPIRRNGLLAAEVRQPLPPISSSPRTNGLLGTEARQPLPPISSLSQSGAEARQPLPPITSLSGAEVRQPLPPISTLSGAEARQPLPPISSLSPRGQPFESGAGARQPLPPISSLSPRGQPFERRCEVLSLQAPTLQAPPPQPLPHIALTPLHVRSFQMPRMQQHVQPMQQMLLQAAPYRALTRGEAEALEQISTAARTLAAINTMTYASQFGFGNQLFSGYCCGQPQMQPMQQQQYPPQPQPATLTTFTTITTMQQHQMQLQHLQQGMLLQPEVSPAKTWYLDDDEDEDLKENEEEREDSVLSCLDADQRELDDLIIHDDGDSGVADHSSRDDTLNDMFDEYDEDEYDAEFAMELNQHL